MPTPASLVFLAMLLTNTTVLADDQAWHLAPSITSNFMSQAQSKYLVLPYGDVNLSYGDVGPVTLVTGVIGHPTQPFPRQDLARLATEFFQNSTGRQMSTLKSPSSVAAINSRCPSGIELRITDAFGVEYFWVTIVEGKLYFVHVKASSHQALKSGIVKAFLASVQIENVTSGR
ncbi:MAG: hypothetical protein QM703_27760 [Gemmatales bacterium]